MSLRLLYIITPVSGFLKNYLKYKRVNLATFARTPLVYFWIDLFLCLYKVRNPVLWCLILERWFFFYYKIVKSYWQDVYHVRREKYEKKYGLRYEDKITLWESLQGYVA
jgi:hypothetical protein